MKTKLTYLLSVLVLFGVLAPSYSQILIDTFTPPGSASTRVAASSPGSYLSFANNVTIGTIGVKVDLNSAGNLRFLIFDHSTAALLYASAPKAFSDDGDTWKTSDPFAFTFLGGQSYDVGAIADVGGLWDYDQISETMNGITSIVTNPNFSNFNSPTTGGYAAADAAVRLSAVPEPGTATLLLLGMTSFAVRSHRRSRAGSILSKRSS